MILFQVTGHGKRWCRHCGFSAHWTARLSSSGGAADTASRVFIRRQTKNFGVLKRTMRQYSHRYSDANPIADNCNMEVLSQNFTAARKQIPERLQRYGDVRAFAFH